MSTSSKATTRHSNSLGSGKDGMFMIMALSTRGRRVLDCCKTAARHRRLNTSTLTEPESLLTVSECEDAECRHWCWQTFR